MILTKNQINSAVEGQKMMSSKVAILQSPITVNTYLDPKQIQPGISRTHSESFDMEKLTSLLYIIDKDNYKELSNQLKRCVIGNVHCKPKGPFLR